MPENSAIDTPLVTIITVTYNSSGFVSETIESVLAQTYKNIEYIIGDDCSSDDTWNIINKYQDSRIKKYRNETNLREYPNRSKALQMATGKYLIFIDGDDVIYPHGVAAFLSFAVRFPDCSMYFSREWDYKILCPYKISPVDIYRFDFLDKGIIGGNFTNVFFNTTILQETGLPLNVVTGDTYVQLIIAKKYPALIIPDGLTFWRRRQGNATEIFFGSAKSYAETIGYRLAMLNKDCPLNETETHLARRNLYGALLKKIVRMMLKGKIKDAMYLLRTIDIPVKYYSSLFFKGRYNYFDFVKGDNPLHSN